MWKKGLVLVVLVSLVVLGGCATTRKDKEFEIQGLRNQVSVLEAQIQSKDEEINSLKESLAKAPQEKESTPVRKVSRKKIIGEVKERPNVKQVQIALRNAGFEPGKLDGKMGKQTIEAIKAFQKANGFHVTGKVDKRTWRALREYLYKKLK